MKRKGPRKPGRRDYLIGFGRPPKATQFKKGTSGNKKGRPKGAKNFATLFEQEMNQKVVVALGNGERQTITISQAVVKQLHNKAARGDLKAIQTIINIARELGHLIPSESLQQPQTRRFTLNIFEKNIETGQYVPVKKPIDRKYYDDE